MKILGENQKIKDGNQNFLEETKKEIKNKQSIWHFLAIAVFISLTRHFEIILNETIDPFIHNIVKWPNIF